MTVHGETRKPPEIDAGLAAAALAVFAHRHEVVHLLYAATDEPDALTRIGALLRVDEPTIARVLDQPIRWMLPQFRTELESIATAPTAPRLPTTPASTPGIPTTPASTIPAAPRPSATPTGPARSAGPATSAGPAMPANSAGPIAPANLSTCAGPVVPEASIASPMPVGSAIPTPGPTTRYGAGAEPVADGTS